MMLRRLFTFFALLAIGLFETQASARPFPSLVRRPAETRDRVIPTPEPIKAAPRDAQLVAQVADLTARAQQGAAAFTRDLPVRRAAVMAGLNADVGKEDWVVAQMAISALDEARYDSVLALASLDSLAVNRRNVDDPARAMTDRATIDPARAQVVEMVDIQNDVLDQLRSGLKTP